MGFRKFNNLPRNGDVKDRCKGPNVFVLSATNWPADHEMTPARTVFGSLLCHQSLAQAGHAAVDRIL